jgi:hypothetical protein
VTSGTVVVAIRISLALKLFDYSKYRSRQKDRPAERVYWLDASGCRRVHSSQNRKSSEQRDLFGAKGLHMGL